MGIEVTIEVDANGILQVTAADKGTGKSEKITITSEKGRLSEKEIRRMIEEAEEYAEEDRIVRERVEARNGFESYLYGLKNHMEDEDRSRNLASEDKRELLDLVDEKLEWMEANPEALKEDFEEQQKDVEQIATPLMRQTYENDADEDMFSDEDPETIRDGLSRCFKT